MAKAIIENNFFDVSRFGEASNPEIDQEYELVLYLAGFIAADGCIEKKRGVYNILSLSIADKEPVELLRNSVCPTKQIEVIQPRRPRDKSTLYRIRITSQKLCDDLAKFFNITPKKSHTLQFPRWLENDHMSNHFIRGYFDGDGHIGPSNKARTQFKICICGSEAFLCDMLTIIKQLIPTEESVRQIKNKNCYEFRIGGNLQVYNLCRIIYANANYYLARKKSVFDDLSKLKLNFSKAGLCVFDGSNKCGTPDKGDLFLHLGDTKTSGYSGSGFIDVVGKDTNIQSIYAGCFSSVEFWNIEQLEVKR